MQCCTVLSGICFRADDRSRVILGRNVAVGRAFRESMKFDMNVRRPQYNCYSSLVLRPVLSPEDTRSLIATDVLMRGIVVKSIVTLFGKYQI